MAVRNFYVRGDVDGRKTYLTGGPVRKDGGMVLYITQRNDGDIERAYTIDCYEYNGELTTRIWHGDEMVHEYKTRR